MKPLTPLHGMTPAQIKRAIYGEPSKKHAEKTSVPKKTDKPTKAIRKKQTKDFGTLLDLPYSTTSTAVQYPTPDWFTYKQKADVSVIVPIHRNLCAELIEGWDLGADGYYVELIFVDDNCPVDSKSSVITAWAKRRNELRGPVGRIFYSMATQGWPACCNIGAEKASANVIVFLNPNAKVSPGWLRPLVKSLRKMDVGATAGMLINDQEDSISDSGSEWQWESEDFGVIGRTIYNGTQISKPFRLNNCPEDLFSSGEREVINSSCMAIRREEFVNLGGFSANLTSREWADADLCYRLREKGLKVLSMPASPVSLDVKDTQDSHWITGKNYFLNKWVVSGRLNGLTKEARKEYAEPEHILVRRGSAHGDVLIATSVLPALKKKYPKARISFSTYHPEILEGNPHVNEVFEGRSERRFDMYINLDMAYEYRPNTNILTAYAEACGVSVGDCEPFLKTKPLGPALPSRYVAMHAGRTMWVGRNWSSIKFDSVSKKLKEQGFEVVAVGCESDHRPAYCDLDLRGKTDIHQLAGVIKGACLFVGIDSLPMHMAQIFNVNGVAFFGSVRANSRLYRSCIKPVFADGLKCLGCHNRKPTPCTATTVCEMGVQECINTVSVDTFWQAVQQAVKKTQSP